MRIGVAKCQNNLVGLQYQSGFKHQPVPGFSGTGHQVNGCIPVEEHLDLGVQPGNRALEEPLKVVAV